MLLRTLVLFSLISQAAFASHLEKVCESATAYPTVWEDNLVAYLDGGEMTLSTHGGMIIWSGNMPIKEIIQDGISIWLLTPTSLEEMNSGGEILNSYPIASANAPGSYALSMVRARDLLVITSGYGGMMGFDLEKRAFTWHNSLSGADDGYASGIAFDGDKLLVATATSMPDGFTGIMAVDATNGTVLKRGQYDVPRSGVISTDATAKMVGDRLLLNNGGWLHAITPEQLNGTRAIRPRWVAHVVPRNGEVNQHYMVLNGGFVMHDDMVMGCGVYTASENGALVRKSKLFHVKLP